MRKVINPFLDVRNDRKMIYIDSYRQGGLPTEGLVAYYPFNGNANDESGNGNNGTVVGATFSSGEGKNGAYVFDGNDFINIDTVVNDLAATTEGAWCIWVKPADATPPVTEDIISFNDMSANEIITINIQPNGILRLALVDAGSVRFVLDTDSSPFSDGVWAHIAIVQDGASPVMYINGVEVAQTFSNSTDLTAWFSITGGIDSGRIASRNNVTGVDRAFFNGGLDEGMLYNRATSGAEILQIYNFNKAAFGH